mmetsp:Transcript_15921/g.52462  ORF Transcript_15921/g.52462 Transcript_15921/m.52462 type:complete len:281 (-) Transcript_15921:432-1274(-)
MTCKCTSPSSSSVLLWAATSATASGERASQAYRCSKPSWIAVPARGVASAVRASSAPSTSTVTHVGHARGASSRRPLRPSERLVAAAATRIARIAASARTLAVIAPTSTPFAPSSCSWAASRSCPLFRTSRSEMRATPTSVFPRIACSTTSGAAASGEARPAVRARANFEPCRTSSCFDQLIGTAPPAAGRTDSLRAEKQLATSMSRLTPSFPLGGFLSWRGPTLSSTSDASSSASIWSMGVSAAIEHSSSPTFLEDLPAVTSRTSDGWSRPCSSSSSNS